MTKPMGILGRKHRLSIAFTDISKLEVHKYHESYVKEGAVIGALAGAALPFILLSREEDSDSTEGLSGLGYFVLPPFFAFVGSLGGAFVGAAFSHDVWAEIDLSPSNAKKGHRRLSYPLQGCALKHDVSKGDVMFDLKRLCGRMLGFAFLVLSVVPLSHKAVTLRHLPIRIRSA